ncbi:MAG TPA: twin-arginine translocase subunit TatC [Chloroflexia bacterium]|nr:twin-arginine translocase subunit TatC [Chloroflexia bacterium]
MALIAHVREFRDRLIKVVVGVIITTALSFVYVDTLIDLFVRLKPANVPLVAFNPTEKFTTYFQVALTFGIILAMPVIVYQVFRFIAPGLVARERFWVLLSIPLVTLFFLAGTLFCYMLVLPSALAFLYGFGSDQIGNIQPIGSFIGFATSFLLVVGLTFEIPPVMFLLAKLRLITYKRLGGLRRYVVVIAFVLAAIITPTPDPVNQAIVAVAIYLLYELGVLFARFA